MKTVKRIIIALVITALVAGACAGGVYQLRKGNQKTVQVTAVSSLASEYYPDSDSAYMYGTITTNVTQNITLDDDMIIEQIYVQKGDSVKTGDKLISFDMTLVEMELNIAKLQQEKLQRNLKSAQNRLATVQNGGAVKDSDASTYVDDTSGIDSSSDSSSDTGSEDVASASGSVSGNYLAAALNPILLTAFTSQISEAAETDGTQADSQESQDLSEDAVAADDFSAGADSQNSTSQSDTGTEAGTEMTTEEEGGTGEVPGDLYQDQDASQFDSGEKKKTPTPTPTQAPYPTQDPDSDIVDVDENRPDDANKNFTDGNEKFYAVLDENSVPYEGEGTEEDPYIFLVSSAQGKVTAMGSFFNKMAGYSADGTQVEHEGGYWYILEFHNGDAIGDYTDRKASCTGYYEVDGSLLSQPVDAFTQMDFTLADAMQYDNDEPDPDPNPSPDDNTTTITRSEAINALKRRISSLEISIREGEINITKLEKKVAKQTITSKIDGIVSTVGDASTGKPEDDSNYFLSVKSADGFFVTGTVSESMLDSMPVGTKLSCTNYYATDPQYSNFEAEIMEISPYPVSSTDDNYGSNPNSSTYTYTATIADSSFTANPGDYCDIQVLRDASESGGFVLDKAFVKSENGTNYVFVDDNGILKKKAVKGRNVYNGYSFLVTAGLSQNDKIAFAYGKNTIEGTATTEVTSDVMYGYN